MKAARLNPGASSLRLEEVPEPRLRSGAVVVRLQSAFVSTVMSRLVDGSGHYHTPARPFTPGMCAIGRVEAAAADVWGLTAGELVYCDPYLESTHIGAANDIALNDGVFLGNFGMGLASDHLLREWPDGVYAERILLPADCILPIRPVVPFAADVLCRLGWLGSAYAGFQKVGFQPGQTVAICGASGILGAGAVLIALALGARRIYAIGRRREALQHVAALDRRIVPTTGVDWDDEVDCVMNCAYGDDLRSIEGILPKLRRGGAFVAVSYIKRSLSLSLDWMLTNDITMRGSMWYPRRAVGELLRLAESGALQLSALSSRAFPLEQANEAIAEAHRVANPLTHVSIRCG